MENQDPTDHWNCKQAKTLPFQLTIRRNQTNWWCNNSCSDRPLRKQCSPCQSQLISLREADIWHDQSYLWFSTSQNTRNLEEDNTTQAHLIIIYRLLYSKNARVIWDIGWKRISVVQRLTTLNRAQTGLACFGAKLKYRWSKLSRKRLDRTRSQRPYP